MVEEYYFKKIDTKYGLNVAPSVGVQCDPNLVNHLDLKYKIIHLCCFGDLTKNVKTKEDLISEQIFWSDNWLICMKLESNKTKLIE